MNNNKQYIREGQKVTFSAQLEKGDRRLTSWIVYEGNQCDDNHIVKEEKQVGTEFSHIFEEAGEYTIVSYGKRDEIDDNKAIKLQVEKPVLEGIECVERANTYFKNNVYIVKKGTKVTFRLKFKDDVLPTSDKLLHLVKVIPIGGTSSGKIIREGKENEYSYNAINRSSYTVIAKFGNRTFEFSMRVVENFEEEVKKFEESIAKNSSTEITTIPSGIENVRSKDSLKLKFNPKGGEPEINPSNLVWKLNGNTLLAKGTQIEIPREIIANNKGENKVEVFKNNASTKSVASYNFSVVKNEIIKFDVSETPKFGKKVTFKVKEDKKYMIFPKLEINEEIYWEVKKGSIFVARGTGLTFEHKFNEEGDFQVKCYISDVVIEEKYNIKRPKIFPETAQWIDKDGATGNILKKAGYYQKIYAFVEHQGLLGEKVIVDVYDDDKASADDWIASNYQLVENKENICVPFILTNEKNNKKYSKDNRSHKERIENCLSKEGKLFFKVKSVDPQFHIGNSEAELAKHLTIVPDSEIVDTYFCDEGDTVKYDIQKLSTSIFLKIYAINMVSRKIRVCVLENVSDTTRQFMNWDSYYRKSLCQKEVTINDKGEAILPIDLTKFKQYNNGTVILSAVMIRSEYKLGGKDYTDYYRINAKIVLIKEPSLPHMKENFSPVKVKSSKVDRIAIEKEQPKEENKNNRDENTIYITRKWEKWVGNNGGSATYGTFVFGDITGFICEPHGPQTTRSGKDKRIPTGTYNLEWYPKSGKFPKNVYTKEGRYVIRKYKPFSATYINFPELKNAIIQIYNKDVSKKRHILLHAGYEGGWTEGCINPFKTLSEKLRDKNIELKESIELLFEIYDKIDKIGIEKVKIVIVDEINKPKSKEDEKYGEFIKKRPR
ncbi:DUF5675 family protein [Capnocytophaga catalasegens]|uniref:DUF5675 domain-containing protein n=1 Tax=Capnocytophaga catalasegens TaxID=1004260 RepID=A0AAV5AWJ4_9FLAO|nr:DUF5675 family protein [Capnocytophaga catalasegens]GIZ16399.1 hypothetical protein RCZ03_23990 [Capnocytophaga catalasegens]GJM50060.1 hypothetical protein RCZ15_10340 [Capnocytophaga catalasegens]GJM52384.1 hypothetical protein RCZ16_07010 [Capnocytophaga catalasegens]